MDFLQKVHVSGLGWGLCAISRWGTAESFQGTGNNFGGGWRSDGSGGFTGTGFSPRT